MTKTRIVLVHGLDGFGAAAWPAQHRLAGRYDALFLKRTGFDTVAPPQATDFEADTAIVISALGTGGHLVAHAQGAVAAMMAAVERPDLVKSLVLVEPALLSLTAELPATLAYREHLEPLYAKRAELRDTEFAVEFHRLTASSAGSTTGLVPGTASAGTASGAGLAHTQGESAQRRAARTRMQAPPWEAPLHIVPGVPTVVITGGWEPLYEEIAEYLVTTGARHVITRGGHRPQDGPDGAALIEHFLAEFAGRPGEPGPD
ncbi:alpha/beta fold hydrolase [Arthrobacter sp. GMC3]|uniref:alpha/beta fold hydrolase n=1 Tax=Arthrobacter sp. GMC3 TaxID=2058894 RepID=UPI000CE365D7|nr:alpha/beta hydrolase [Arthrobacter sp. GMC3]